MASALSITAAAPAYMDDAARAKVNNYRAELDAAPHRELVYAYVAHAIEWRREYRRRRYSLMDALNRVPAYLQQGRGGLYRTRLDKLDHVLRETVGIVAVATGERHTVLPYVTAAAAPVTADAHAKHRLAQPRRHAQDVAHTAANRLMLPQCCRTPYNIFSHAYARFSGLFCYFCHLCDILIAVKR